jgi:hypothetical protein
MAEDVNALLEWLGWLDNDDDDDDGKADGKVDVVGISLGGMIAMGEFRGPSLWNMYRSID